MTDALKLSTLTASIAAASITVTKVDTTSGTLTIKDTSGVMPAVPQGDCPILQPRPDLFLTEFALERDTYGGDVAYKTARYTLHYQFFFAPVLQGVTVYADYAANLNALVAILNYYAVNTNAILSGGGATEILPLLADALPQKDVTGTLFHGGVIDFQVVKYMET